MAVRLYSEFKSDQSILYRIEIHDTQWAAASTTFKVDSRGFELTYDGETDDIVSPIVGSKLTFGAYSTDGTFETFIALLKTFQENRFRVVVYRPTSNWESWADLWNNASDPWDEISLYWIGWLTQDLVNVEDVSQPYIYEMTATDGIGRLANIDHTAANVVNEANGFKTTRVTDVLRECFESIGTYDLWGASDVFFETSSDWWETIAQTYSTAVDPLYNQGFDVRYFRQKDDDGNDVYSTALELLRQMATLFNARIYMQRGRFIFEQYGNRDSASRYVSKYDKNGVQLERISLSDDLTLNQTITGGARRSGNNWNFLPAAQLAKIHYVQRFLNPFNAFGLFRFRNATNAYTAGFIAGGSGVQLEIGSTAFNFMVVGAVTITAPIFPVFKMRIRIQDSSTGTYYYCNRAYNGYAAGGATFGIPAWSTTAGEYFFDLPMFFSSGTAIVTHPVAIITPDIPVNGELDFLLSLHGVFKGGNGTTYTPSQTPLFDAIFVFAIATDGAANAPGATFSSTNGEAGIDSNLIIDLGDVFIADGPRQSGHLAAYNGTNWVGTSAWRKGSSGATNPILKLLSNETLALHVRPIEQYNGSIIATSLFGQRIVFDSEAYLMTGGTFTANIDEWSGTWYRIQTIRGSVTALASIDDLVNRTPLGSATTSGESPNDIIGGRIGGMAIDIENEKVGPYQQTATGGRINGTANVTGATTLSTTLGVTGATTLSSTLGVTGATSLASTLGVTGTTTMNAATINGTATLSAKSNVNGSWNAKIIDVGAGAGGEYTIQSTDYILFVNYTGGNGTFTINLPPVASNEGRMIRIKTDSTISNLKALSIEPDAGDTGATIDGEASSAMTRPYDGATYLCHNGDWYVIQKKEK